MRGTVLCMWVLTAMLAAGTAPPAAAADDSDAGVRAGRDDVFVVRGADQSVQPGSEGDSGCAGGCPRTVVTPVCAVDRWGNPPPPGTGECLDVPDLCPEGQVARRVWTEEAGSWRPGSEQCMSEAAAVPVAVIAAGVVERVRHRVPAPAPARQPAQRALVALPVLYHSGQTAGPRTWTDEVAGFQVTTTVAPSWEWDFGDGSAGLITRTPGSRYPDLSVSHTYESAGAHRVTLTTTWDGTFTIAGAGTFPIDGEVVQEAGLDVRVVEARAVWVLR